MYNEMSLIDNERMGGVIMEVAYCMFCSGHHYNGDVINASVSYSNTP